jgi:hypothetical protein
MALFHRIITSMHQSEARSYVAVYPSMLAVLALLGPGDDVRVTTPSPQAAEPPVQANPPPIATTPQVSPAPQIDDGEE